MRLWAFVEHARKGNFERTRVDTFCVNIRLQPTVSPAMKYLECVRTLPSDEARAEKRYLKGYTFSRLA